MLGPVLLHLLEAVVQGQGAAFASVLGGAPSRAGRGQEVVLHLKSQSRSYLTLSYLTLQVQTNRAKPGNKKTLRNESDPLTCSNK